MENAVGTFSEPLLLRANRKVIEVRCDICNEGFNLTEQIYSCPVCSGYHHLACWEGERACRVQNGQQASVTVASKQQKIETPVMVTPPPAAVAVEQERKCSSCAKTIRLEAVKCRFCGCIFDQAYAQAAGEIPRQLADQIESYANTSLTTSIIGLIFCFLLSPILGGIAISNGNSARRLLNEFPSYSTQTYAGGKALAGIIIGWVQIILFVMIILSAIGGGQ